MTTPNSLITTRFGATSTAEDVVAGLDLTNVRAIVTGASSGIGLETARALASAGAEVTLAVRNTAAGVKAAEDIAKSPWTSLIKPRSPPLSRAGTARCTC